MKPVQPDTALSAVVGNKPIPRTEVTKKLWAYIKRKGLQDKKKRTNINADDALKAVFGGKKTVTMFEMTKLVSKHLKEASPIPNFARARSTPARALLAFVFSALRAPPNTSFTCKRAFHYCGFSDAITSDEDTRL